ncbi:hypothetical protein OH492_08710 [Vibrio chagasii]|nr:hypothetical protein [Vibrio chagasii]
MIVLPLVSKVDSTCPQRVFETDLMLGGAIAAVLLWVKVAQNLSAFTKPSTSFSTWHFHCGSYYCACIF